MKAIKIFHSFFIAPTFVEKDKIIVLWLIFSPDKLDFLTSSFGRDFFVPFEKYCRLELEIKNIYISLVNFSKQIYKGFKIPKF